MRKWRPLKNNDGVDWLFIKIRIPVVFRPVGNSMAYVCWMPMELFLNKINISGIVDFCLCKCDFRLDSLWTYLVCTCLSVIASDSPTLRVLIVLLRFSFLSTIILLSFVRFSSFSLLPPHVFLPFPALFLHLTFYASPRLSFVRFSPVFKSIKNALYFNIPSIKDFFMRLSSAVEVNLLVSQHIILVQDAHFQSFDNHHYCYSWSDSPSQLLELI